MKPVLAALAIASLAATPLAAAAQHQGGGHSTVSSSGGWAHGASTGSGWRGAGGGWHGPSGSSWAAGAWRGPGGSWGGGIRSGGFHHHFRDGFPIFFGGFGLGFALGSVWDPWFWDAPYYGYPAYTVVEHDYVYPPDDGYYYDHYNRDYGPPPPPPQDDHVAAPPPAACGSWQWDTARGQYNWIPCAPNSAAAPPR